MQKTMPLRKLMRKFTNGDQTSWDAEIAWLRENHPRRLTRLRAEIAAEGIVNPIRLCYRENRVVDGHHRIAAALDLGLRRVPVADAWDGSDWWMHAEDYGGDDPVPAEEATL